jgi:hypothetical protein
MPRKPRLHVPGGFYHVILRGNHREPLFRTPGDQAYLNALTGDVAARFEMRILAYCWMTNTCTWRCGWGRTASQPMQRLACPSRDVHRTRGR